jgi:hypothetical protein
MTDKIKSCKYCGETCIGHIADIDKVKYICINCGCSFGFSYGNTENQEVWEKALATWNARTTPAPDLEAIAKEVYEAMSGTVFVSSNGTERLPMWENLKISAAQQCARKAARAIIKLLEKEQ